MRRLMLLRHAKSDWSSGGADHDRPLAPRGREAAPQLGDYMAKETLIPDLTLVSSARRAAETWELAAPMFAETVTTRREPSIYDAPASRLLALVQAAPDTARTLLLVGHNPGFEDLAALLTGFGDRYAFARLREKYPTAGLAVIDFDVQRWSELMPRGGRLERFITPKSLGGEDD